MMNKNIMMLFISLFLCFFLLICCKNSDADSKLAYLKTNFNNLYMTDYNNFWEILYGAQKRALSCKSAEDAVVFLGLVEIDSGNAEFNEYFNGVIEEFCVEKPKCFLDALSKLDNSAITRTVNKLKAPLFVDNKDIDAVFNKNKDIKKYNVIMKIYFLNNN